MTNLKIKLRKKGDKEWIERGLYGVCRDEVSDSYVRSEVECFAEEWGLHSGDVVEVYRMGKYKVDVEMIPECYATRIK